jgi:heat shock protein HslJ
MKFIILLLGLLSIKDCNSINKNNHLEPQKSTSNVELNGAYMITSIGDKDVSSYSLEISFNPEENRVSGFAGCNRFFGNYKFTGDSLQFGAIGSTKMLCDEEKNAVEMELFEALSKVNRISYINNDTINVLNEETLVLTMQKKSQKNEYVFEYSALSRGSYKNIIIDKNTVKVLNQRNAKPHTKPCIDKQWDVLLNLVKKIDLENISDLEAPSAKRLYDGAPIGNLTISYNGNIYKSSSFDHGNPPTEIASIVKEILSISENLE